VVVEAHRADHSVALQGSSSICFISTDFNLHFIVDVLAQLVMLCHTAEFRHVLLNLNVGVNLNLLAFGFNLVDVWILQFPNQFEINSRGVEFDACSV
jgi:hypothetical protein